MTRFKTAVQNDFKLLELLHDELALQAHLLAADAKVKWEALEGKWSDLKSHVERAAAAGETAEHETEAAIRLLSDTLRSGYASIRKALKN